MDDFTRTKRQYLLTTVLLLLASNMLVIAAWVTLRSFVSLSNQAYAVTLGVFALIISILLGLVLTKHLTSPIKALWQLIVHITPKGTTVPAPQIDSLKIGKKMIEDLATQVYQLTSAASSVRESTSGTGGITRMSLCISLF